MPPEESAGVPLLVGLTGRAAPPELGTRLFTDEPDHARLLADLHAAGFTHGMVLCTCERLEVLTLAPTANAATELALGRLVAAWADCPEEEIAPLLTVLHGPAALRHLFAVATALDSQVLGEPQVLGQVKDSHRAAQAAGMAGPELDAMLQAAYGAARRVRGETALAQQPVSIAAAAVKIARQVHGDLRRATALLLGLGEMADIMAGQLRDAGVGDIAVTHPLERRAAAAARRLGVHLRPWEDLETGLAHADIVVATLGEGRYTLDEARMRRVLKRRRQRPMFIMDAAVPGDVEPAVEDLDPAFVYDLGELEQVAQEGRAQREAAALAAWRIVDAELDAFEQRRDRTAADSAVAALHAHAEALRAEVLSDGRLDAEAATRLLLRRLLHTPARVLREAADRDPAARLELEDSLRRLFALDRSDGESAGAADAEDADDRKDGKGTGT